MCSCRPAADVRGLNVVAAGEKVCTPVSSRRSGARRRTARRGRSIRLSSPWAWQHHECGIRAAALCVLLGSCALWARWCCCMRLRSTCVWKESREMCTTWISNCCARDLPGCRKRVSRTWWLAEPTTRTILSVLQINP